MVALAHRRLDEEEVQFAWGIYRAYLMAEREDPSLADKPEHIRQIAVARHRFQSFYAEWCAQ